MDRKLTGNSAKLSEDCKTRDKGGRQEMKMKPEEIRREFTEAKNKQEQIKILSELNLCSREQIIEILIGQGIPEAEIPKARARKKQPANKRADIPQSVKDAVAARIVQLTEEAEERERQVKELNAFLKAAQEA